MLIGIAEILLLSGFVLLIHTYIGYALIIRFFPSQKRRIDDSLQLPVTIVIPAFNEEKVLANKIGNCRAVDYPAHLLQLLVVNDGSTDNTAAILNKMDVQHITMAERVGKTAALNYAMHHVHTPVTIFTDANALLDRSALRKLVRHFADERVGGVSAEKRIITNAHAVATAEQMYWRYESFLKQSDSDFYSVVGADGGLFAIRTHLFKPVDPKMILDDFFISVNVCRSGSHFVYDSEAFASEASSATIEEEEKRKIRISAGCFQALTELYSLLNPFTKFRMFFIFLSHRVFRWTICPLLLPLLLLTNVWLYVTTHAPLHAVLLLVQLICYVFAFAGWLQQRLRFRTAAFLLPYYFVFMNIALYRGFLRFISKRQSVKWQKPQRAEA